MNDDYFRICWLMLKAAKPRMQKLMAEIELQVAGIRTTKPANKTDAPDKSTIERV